MLDKTWTLFLDRDGIINERIVDGYVTTIHEFVLKKDFLLAMPSLQSLFARIIVVTNQQGIGKGLMTFQEVEEIHQHIQKKLKTLSIDIDKFYICPHLAEANCKCRKPNIGMALTAQKDFPQIDFEKSVMIGDSLSDLLFGKRLNMKTVYIPSDFTKISTDDLSYADFICKDLIEFSKIVQ